MSLRRLWEALTGRVAVGGPAAVRPQDMPLPIAGPLTIRRDFDGAEAEPVILLKASEQWLSFRAVSPLQPGQKIVVKTVARRFKAVVRHVGPQGFDFVVGAEILPPG